MPVINQPVPVNPSGYINSAPMTVVHMGDSFNNNAWNTTGTNNATYAIGIFERFNVKARQAFRVLGNVAIGGTNTGNWLTGSPSQVQQALAFNPGWVFIASSGTNDYNAGLTSAQTIANLTAIITTFRSRGINVILGTIPASTRAAGVQANVLANCQINQWLRDYASKIPGVFMVDFAAYAIDTSSMTNANTGVPQSAVLQSDGLHPNSVGAGIFGETAMYNVLAPFIINQNLSAVNNLAIGGATGDTTLITANPLLIQGSGGTAGTGVTGTVAQGFTVQRNTGTSITGTASLVARASAPAYFNNGLPGYVQRIDVANSAGSADGMAMVFSPTNGQPAGLTCEISCEFYATMSSGTLSGLWVYGIMTGGASNLSVYGVQSDVVNKPLTLTTWSGVLRSRPFTVPSGTTSTFLDVYIYTSASATGSIYIANPQMRVIQY